MNCVLPIVLAIVITVQVARSKGSYIVRHGDGWGNMVIK